jgi:hypothetical protein
MAPRFDGVMKLRRTVISNRFVRSASKAEGLGVTVTCLGLGASETEFFELTCSIRRLAKPKKAGPVDVAMTSFDAMMAGKATSWAASSRCRLTLSG